MAAYGVPATKGDVEQLRGEQERGFRDVRKEMGHLNRELRDHVQEREDRQADRSDQMLAKVEQAQAQGREDARRTLEAVKELKESVEDRTASFEANLAELDAKLRNLAVVTATKMAAVENLTADIEHANLQRLSEAADRVERVAGALGFIAAFLGGDRRWRWLMLLIFVLVATIFGHSLFVDVARLFP